MAPADVVCRVLEERRLAKLVDRLTRGFPGRPRAFLTDSLARPAALGCSAFIGLSGNDARPLVFQLRRI